jgi:uncharacterized lipoprotein NlpE involved in copper resistance
MFAIAYMVIFSLMGCMNNQNDKATNTGDNNEAENVGFKRNQEGNRKDVNNNNRNQTAYVAVVLRDAANEEGPPAEDLFKEEFKDVVPVIFPDAQ